MSKKIEKMSDEDLAIADEKSLWRLRVSRKDGSIIPGRRSADVFFQAVKESQATFEELSDIHVTKKPLVTRRTTGSKMKGYSQLYEDVYMYRSYSSKNMAAILEIIDYNKQMYWDIELM